MKIRSIVFTIVFISSIVQSGFTKEITYSDLVDRLIDLEALTVLPEKGEQTALWSSYDRHSIYDVKTGEYENWDANNDGLGQYIRMEGKQCVMAEMQGPGAIVRIWSAQPEEGHVKIYIDGREIPAVDLPFRQYFDNSVKPFNYPELAYDAASGKNNYMPIPYQKFCKVVADSGWGNYFHFTYITFPKGTKIRSFITPIMETDREHLQFVNDFLANKRGLKPPNDGSAAYFLQGEKSIAPGETVTLADINGEYAINSLRVKTDFQNRHTEESALRKLLLSMYWDNETEPSVWSPLGDFFGSAPGKNNYQSLPLGMTDTDMYSFWVMPFAEHAAIRITNTDSRTHTIAWSIAYRPLQHSIKKLGRFHAKWHSNVFPLEDPARWPDWTLLQTTGKGRFVGLRLHVLNPDGESCKEFAGPGHAWWGEGDEKFFVDGEKFPSTFGTGTEDYFGYAWGNPQYFSRAFHNQSMTMNNIGHQCVARFHIIDNVPFQKSFDGFLEKYYPDNCGTQYDCVVYWYLDKDGHDPHKPVEVYVDKWIPAPVLEPAKGLFLPGDSVKVAILRDNNTIRYTLDNHEPNLESQLYTTPLIISETSVVKAKAFNENGLESATIMGFYEMTSLRPSVEVPGKLLAGLAYSYYEGEWTELPDFSAFQPLKTGIIEQFGLPPIVREDDYGLQFTGYIKIPVDGLYAFYLNSDDGSKLYIDDNMIINNDKCHGETEVFGQVALSSGFHPIKLNFFESRLYNVLELRYSGPGIEKQLVPAGCLYHAE